MSIIMIVALCMVLTLLGAPSVALGPEEDVFASPCPDVFTAPDDEVPKTEITTVECGLVTSETVSNEGYPLIYGGNFYERGQIPWLVAIYRLVNGTLIFICGGTLVSDRHVLTAAHCMRRPGVVTPIEEIVVKVGAHSLNDLSDNVVVTRKLTATSIHEEYDPYTLQTDIMVLTLDKGVKFNKYIRPACLWSCDTELSRVVGVTGVVAGWGDRSMNDTRGRSDEPQMLRIPIVSTKECRASKAVFHKLTYNTTLCAGDQKGTGPCTGDSGGGLYLLDGNKWRLRGIVSLSLKNEALTCNLNEYIVFTDTAQFLPWIRNIIPGKYFKPESSSEFFESFYCGVVALSENTSYARGVMPWHVALYAKRLPLWHDIDYNNNWVYFCGGTLVSDRHIITAAQCLKTIKMARTVVRIGISSLNDWIDDLTITRIPWIRTIHEGFDPHTLQNNIMVLTLHKRVQFDRYIRPACLWSGDTELSRVVGAIGVMTVWDDQQQDRLKLVRMPIVSTEDCRKSNSAFFNHTRNNTLCAVEKNGKGPCLGFVGSGLFLPDGGKWRLRGVSSVAIELNTNNFGTCNLNEYMVFTDIAQFLPWIRNILLKKVYD